MILTVKDVDYLGDYTLLCTFNDGVTKKVDFAASFEISGICRIEGQEKVRSIRTRPNYLLV